MNRVEVADSCYQDVICMVTFSNITGHKAGDLIHADAAMVIACMRGLVAEQTSHVEVCVANECLGEDNDELV